MKKLQTTVVVDERLTLIQFGFTIMQACANLGVDIPRFCYHDKLLIAGNCRICLVEVLGSKKLVASCAVHITENMVIFTNTLRVRLARQNVLEFLLANHPLDCPICDQGGECDLQDITSLFGADRGRFYEQEKRSVLNKEFGPLIRTSMNRCIHCTRCVRFLAMSTGNLTLGTVGRGSSTEISLYINKFISDELSGNITDLCPVGALTSKPYSFKARPWELTSVKSVDIFDAMNSTLLFDVAANKICRVLPYANDSLNECWLSNKARYAYDGLFLQRLNTCLAKVSLSYICADFENKAYTRFVLSATFVKISWEVAIHYFLKLVVSQKIYRFTNLFGNNLDLESTTAWRLFSATLGVGEIAYDNLFQVETAFVDFNFLYFFNTSLLKLTKLPSFCLLVGTNLRLEAPLINLRLGQLVSNFGISVYKIGGSVNYFAYKVKLLSSSLITLFSICEFKHNFSLNFYVPNFAARPFFLLAGAVLNRFDGIQVVVSVSALISRLTRVCNSNIRTKWYSIEEFSYYGVLQQYSSIIHLSELGFMSTIRKFSNNGCQRLSLAEKMQKSRFSIFYAVGFDSSIEWFKLHKKSYLIYQGSTGVGLATAADVIFPVLTYVEKIGTFCNLLGVRQKTNLVVKYGFESKTDFDVFYSFLQLFKNYLKLEQFDLFRVNGLSFNLALSNSVDLLSDSYLSSEFTVTTRVSAFLSAYYKNFRPKAVLCMFHYLFTYNSKLLQYSLNSSLFGATFSQIGKIFPNLVSSVALNYYGDVGSVFVLASRTMNLCSQLNLKKNFSFTSSYY